MQGEERNLVDILKQPQPHIGWLKRKVFWELLFFRISTSVNIAAKSNLQVCTDKKKKKTLAHTFNYFKQH